MRIFIDIETIPDQRKGALQSFVDNVKAPAQYKKQESIDKWIQENKQKTGEDNWLKTSFDGTSGEVVCISISDGYLLNETFKRGLNESEKDLLVSFKSKLLNWLSLPESLTQKPYFVGHNVGGFDLPFLYKRMVINGVNPEFKLKPHGRHGSDYFCTMEEWAGFKGRISMDNLAKALGVESKTDGMDGSKVWGEIKKGNVDKVAEYCEQDVNVVVDIFNKLTFKY